MLYNSAHVDSNLAGNVFKRYFSSKTSVNAGETVIAASDAEDSAVARLLMQSTRRGWHNRKAGGDKQLIVCNCVRNYFY